MLDHLPHCSQVLDHLGLVAGMFDELGIGDVLNQATQQNPEMRDLTLGEAVKAMVLSCGALQRAPPHDLPGDHHRRTTASPSDRGARVGRVVENGQEAAKAERAPVQAAVGFGGPEATGPGAWLVGEDAQAPLEH